MCAKSAWAYRVDAFSGLGRQTLADLDCLAFHSNQRVYAAKAIKKGSLKVFPFGAVTRVKEEDLKKSGSKVLVSAKEGGTYHVTQPRVDLFYQKGSLGWFFWIPAVADEEQATMELLDTKYEGWLTVPCLRAKSNIAAGSMLAYHKPSVDEPQKKKAKKN